MRMICRPPSSPDFFWKSYSRPSLAGRLTGQILLYRIPSFPDTLPVLPVSVWNVSG